MKLENSTLSPLCIVSSSLFDKISMNEQSQEGITLCDDNNEDDEANGILNSESVCLQEKST